MSAPVSALSQVPDDFIKDLASQMYPAEEVANRHGYTRDQLVILLNQGWFVSRIREARKLWSADSNAATRVKVKAAIAAESTLLDIATIVRDTDASPTARVEAHKHLSKLAGVETKESGDSGQAVFSVTINMPGTAAPVTVTATPVKQAIAGEVVE